MRRRILLLPFLLATTLWSGSALAKDFQDWEVSCDNTRTCQAVGMAGSDGEVSGYLTLERGSQALDKPAISFWVDAENIAGGIADRAFLLTVDDQPVKGLQREIRFVENKDGTMSEAKLGEEETSLLAASFKTGQAVALKAKDGTTTASVSLKGAAATLLYMDDKQQRIGTVTALVRPGDKPASAVPTPPPLPTLAIVKPGKNAKSLDYLQAMWKRLKTSKDSCLQDGDDDGSNKPSGATDALDALHALVTINCPGGGAYNTDTEFYVVTRGDLAHAKPVMFDDFDEDSFKMKRGVTGALTNAAYDPKTGLITHFAKGRGMGDCGATGSYGWDGKAFQLASASSMGACQGVNWDQWPHSWRAKIVR